MGIWDKLVPKEYGFYDLFNRHAACMLDAAKTFQLLTEEWPDATGRARRIEEVEHECDSIAHMTIDLLHHTFITPLDRDEITQLISTMDDVADLIDAAAQRVFMFAIPRMPGKLRELARVLVRAADLVVEVVGKLRDLKDVERMRAIFVEIHRTENEGDGCLRAGMVELFRDSADDPMAVIKLKEILEIVEEAIDQCEDVANIVEGILLEHS